jgi:Flp pilus assembly pilin Flp
MTVEAHMLKELHRFWGDEQGQDMIEYTFLIALVALSTTSLLVTQGTAVSSIWVTGNSLAHNAAIAAS